jgi:hypothetical protein
MAEPDSGEIGIADGKTLARGALVFPGLRRPRISQALNPGDAS